MTVVPRRASPGGRLGGTTATALPAATRMPESPILMRAPRPVVVESATPAVAFTGDYGAGRIDPGDPERSEMRVKNRGLRRIRCVKERDEPMIF
jgi:hypothetical protein